MDKFEYRVRAEEIKTLISRGEYVEAVKIADTIEWHRVKSVLMLCTISDLYKINRRFEESKELLLMAYERNPGGRTIVYSLCELAIKMEEPIQAIEYYKEFVQIAPRDSGRFILQYKLYEAQDVSLEERIAVLEELKKRDYREKWAYELAYLYHRMGLSTKCVEECDELILWFGEGKYVMKAMELKMLHQPLTAEQGKRYEMQMRGISMYEQYDGDEDDEEAGQGDVLKAETTRIGSDELDDIHVKTLDMGQYNTINLQKALAESMKEFLDDGNGIDESLEEEPEGQTGGMAAEPLFENTEEMKAAARKAAENAREPEPVEEEVFFGETGEMPETYETFEDYGIYGVQKSENVFMGENPESFEDVPEEEWEEYEDIPAEGEWDEFEDMEYVPDLEETEGMEDLSDMGEAEEPEYISDMGEAEGMEDLSDVGEAEELEYISDIEETEGLEDLSDVGEAEELEYISDIEETEGLEDLSDVGEAEELEYMPDMEEAEGLEDLSDVGEAEELEYMTDMEETEDIEEFSGVEETEDIADFSYMDELESQEDISDMDGLEYIEDISDSDIGETEDMEDISETEDLEDIEDIEDISDSDTDEAEDIGELEDMEDIPDIGGPETDISDGNGPADIENVPDTEKQKKKEPQIIQKEKPEEKTADTASDVVMRQMRKETEEPVQQEKRSATYQVLPEVPAKLAGMLSQEYDGQISLVVPEGEKVEKQITGQMSIQDILAEWERMKKDNEEKRKEDVRRRVKEQTGNMFAEFDESTRSGILAQLNELDAAVKEKEAQKEKSVPNEDAEGETYEQEEPEEIAEFEDEEEPGPEEIPDAEAEDVPDNYDNYAEDTEEELDEVVGEEPAGSEILEENREETGEMDENAGSSTAPKAAGMEKKIEASEEELEDILDERMSLRQLTEEEKELFGAYIHTRKAKEQFIKSIDSVSMAAYTGNIVVTGDDGNDTITLAKNLVREVQMSDSNFSGKIAKISGASLNKKDVNATLSRMENGALIIENAAALSEETAAKLYKFLDHENKGIIVAITGTKKEINKFLKANDVLKNCFTARFDIESLDDDALAAYGRKYAELKEYSIDDLGMLALHTRISDMQTSSHIVNVTEVQEIVDEAIRHANRKNLTHFFDILLAKRYDAEDMIILRERDFN